MKHFVIIIWSTFENMIDVHHNMNDWLHNMKDCLHNMKDWLHNMNVLLILWLFFIHIMYEFIILWSLLLHTMIQVLYSKHSPLRAIAKYGEMPTHVNGKDQRMLRSTTPNAHLLVPCNQRPATALTSHLLLENLTITKASITHVSATGCYSHVTGNLTAYRSCCNCIPLTPLSDRRRTH